ncbi:MAG: hypothetical protein KDC34_02280 [Saprospiraceae bacterium]|nr:hypothetical protein [Saprospiraceae bacterium]
MDRKYYLLSALCFLPLLLAAQSNLSNRHVELGFEMQAYPTGIIPGVWATYFLTEKDAIHLRLGLQFINHQDFGVQDDEKGKGFGATLGYCRHFGDKTTGIFAGARCDLWRNQINWIDYDGDGPEILDSGISKVLVIQPTAELGYRFLLGSDRLKFAPTVAFGYEINVKTTGAKTGEGAIILLGFLLSWSI